MGRILAPVVMVCCSVLSVAILSPSDAYGDERRDPFVDPRAIEPAPQVKPKLVAVLGDPADPRRSFAIIGEEVATPGDTIGGWLLAEVRHDGIVITRGEHRTFLPVGELLTEP